MVSDKVATGRIAVPASCVVLGSRAVVIRGPSGSGKSTLAWALIREPGPFGYARLVSDDQVMVEARNGRLLASPPEAIAGRIEIRGLGIVPIACERLARIGLIADLVSEDAIPRLPEPEDLRAELAGITVPRLAVPMRNPLAGPLVIQAMAQLAAGGTLAAFTGETG